MRSYQGKGVYEAIAIGRIAFKKQKSALIPRYSIENMKEELARIKAAKNRLSTSLRKYTKRHWWKWARRMRRFFRFIS